MNARIMPGVLILLSMATIASAQPFSIDWHTVDGGGAMSSTGGTFELSGTIGQPDAASSPALTGGTFELRGGFWANAVGCSCLGDLNADGDKDGLDVQKFVNCMVAAGDCSCADVDSMNGVNMDDIVVLVNDLLTGPDCP